ncbi:MAG: sporulation integral membrane protein YtvI [Lachnospiraceae bacterium]|nr:sporulation integral membrane protein YtvI [Lachnospiraceae bacterium]
MNPKVKTYLKVLANLLTAVLVVLIIIFLIPKLIVFFMPFIIGWIISLIAKPIVEFFEKKIKIKRKAGSAIVIILVLAIVIAIVYGICYFLVNQVIDFVQDFPRLWSGLVVEFEQVGDSLMGVYTKLPASIRSTLDSFAANSQKYFSNLSVGSGALDLPSVGNVVTKIPDLIMAVVMALLSSYFFVADKDYLKKTSEKYLPASVVYNWEIIKRSIRNAFGGYFKAQFKIEIWIYLVTVIGLFIIRVDYAILVALGICFMDFLPVFGAGTVMIPWAIIKFFNGEYAIGIGLLIIWGVGQLLRQIIQPKIVGESVGMDSIPTLFLLFIGFAVKGVLGMILAIPIGIILKNLYEEGAFNTTFESISILFAGFNNFRRFGDSDREVIRKYESVVAKTYEEQIKNETDNDASDSESSDKSTDS